MDNGPHRTPPPKARAHPMKVFVPLTDQMLEDNPNPGPLVPYQPGLPPISQLTASARPNRQSSISTSSSPGCTPNSPALPALSSSTYLAGPALE